MSSTTPTNLELITFNYVRNNYEKEYNQNVPEVLKYLILTFSSKIIPCNLISIAQDLELFKLISTKLSNIHRFNLLFRASDHEYGASKFHDYCDNKGPTISIIQSNWGNIFGGYTSKSWKSERRPYKDENAFLFLIKSDDKALDNKCPLLLELDKDDVGRAIEAHYKYGPIFGAGHDIIIYDKCNRKIQKEPLNVCELSHARKWSYINSEVDCICGGDIKTDGYEDYLFQVIDYQIFQVI